MLSKWNESADLIDNYIKIEKMFCAIQRNDENFYFSLTIVKKCIIIKYRDIY